MAFFAWQGSNLFQFDSNETDLTPFADEFDLRSDFSLTLWTTLAFFQP